MKFASMQSLSEVRVDTTGSPSCGEDPKSCISLHVTALVDTFESHCLTFFSSHESSKRAGNTGMLTSRAFPLLVLLALACGPVLGFVRPPVSTVSLGVRSGRQSAVPRKQATVMMLTPVETG